MKTTTLFTKFPAVALGIVLGVSMTPAFSVDDLGLFELDGNPQDDTGVGLPDDWETLYNGGLNDGGSPTVFTGIINDEPWDHDDDPATKEMDTSVFIGGKTKDIHDIGEWLYQYSEPLDKGEITNAYAAAYLNPTAVGVHDKNDLIIYFGMDRYSNDGDAFTGFWFVQDTLGLEPLVKKTAKFIGNHVAKTDTTPGDLLVLVEYPQGTNAEPTVKVYEYDPDDADVDGNDDEDGKSIHPLDLIYHPDDALCDGLGGKLACAITNDEVDGTGNDIGPVPSPWPYAPKGGLLGDDFPYETFYSGGINVTKLLGSTPCISSFLAETRSSRSETAVLKDFAWGSFDVCSIGVTKACEAEINTAGDAVLVSFSGEVTNTGALAFENIELYDDQSNSQINAVCLDGDSPDDPFEPNGLCGDAEDTDIGTYNGDGSANLVLAAGQSAVYEGSYSVSGPISSLEFSDEVTADAYMNSVVIKNDTAVAECVAVGTPGISVTKNCTPSLVGGDTFQAFITGGAENTGNVKLVSVALSDTVFAPADLTVVHDANENGLVDSGEVAFTTGELLPHTKLAFEATFSSTSATAHENTMTVSGDNVFDASDTVSDNATASCGISPAPELEITKVCDESINGTGVELVQLSGHVAVQVGNIITVENTGNEVLNPVQVSDSEMALSTSTAGWSCTSGVCTGPLGLGESITFTQTYYPDGANILGALTNPGSVFFKNTATASGTGVLSTIVKGPYTDKAECKICPPCPDC